MRVLVGLLLIVAIAAATNTADAAYPGANGRIAFSSGGEIWTMEPDGSDARFLTEGRSAPSWSPDGTKLAYTVWQDLFVISVSPDGTADGPPINLTNTTKSSVLRQYPSWSPDGTKLLYEQLGDKGKFDVWVAEPDLTNHELDNQTKLTTARANDRLPSWSPNGDRIAFASDRDGDFEIYTMPVTGESDGLTQLTTNGLDDTGPDWSPDGTQLVYTRTQPSKGNVKNTDVYRMAAGGPGQEQQLTTSTDPDGSGDWSSDGLLIAFVRGDGDAARIYTMTADGGGVTRLSQNAFAEFSPDWRRVPDGPVVPTPPPPCGLPICI